MADNEPAKENGPLERTFQRTDKKEDSATTTTQTTLTIEQKLRKIQIGVRFVNGIFAISIAGMIVTAFIMHMQFFLGNGLKWKYVPKLTKTEQALLVLVDVIVIVLAIAFFTVTSVGVYCMGGYSNAFNCATGL